MYLTFCLSFVLFKKAQKPFNLKDMTKKKANDGIPVFPDLGYNIPTEDGEKNKEITFGSPISDETTEEDRELSVKRGNFISPE